MNPGTVALVGTGPGDPGLVTVRALERVRAADAIVFDYLGAVELLKMARPEAEKICVGKRASQHTLPQEGINDLLVRLAREGKRVVRLKGGDPFVFGRGGEEAEVLAAAGIPFEVVPGVTSGVAAPAYAGIPVTHRESSSCVTLLTGHEDPSKESPALRWRALVESGATLVIYMGVERLEGICEQLQRAGMEGSRPAALVQWGTLPNQRTVSGTLATLVERVREAGMTAPAIAVIGAVAAKRPILRWFDNRPLFGQRVAVTRTREQAGRLVELLREAGAEAVEIPTIKMEPEPWRAGAWAQPRQPDWIVFTSPNAVQLFCGGLLKEADMRALGGIKLAAVGSGTARELAGFGLKADFLPTISTGQDLAEELPAKPGQRILWPCGNLAATTPLQILERRGFDPVRMEIYRTVPDPLGAELARAEVGGRGVDWVIFTSASSAENLRSLGVEISPPVRVATLGPITSKAVKRLGWEVEVEAPEAKMEALVSALEEACRKSDFPGKTKPGDRSDANG